MTFKKRLTIAALAVLMLMLGFASSAQAAKSDCPATRFCLWTVDNYSGARNQFSTGIPWGSCSNLTGTTWNNNFESLYNHTTSTFDVWTDWNPNPEPGHPYGHWDRWDPGQSFADLADLVFWNNTITAVCRGVADFNGDGLPD